MKTETRKLYSMVFWIFLPNFIKIDSYNFEIYRFKFPEFFEIQCSLQIKNWKLHRSRMKSLSVMWKWAAKFRINQVHRPDGSRR